MAISNTGTGQGTDTNPPGTFLVTWSLSKGDLIIVTMEIGFSSVAHVQLEVSGSPVDLTAHCDTDEWLSLRDGAEVVLDGLLTGDTWLDAKLTQV